MQTVKIDYHPQPKQQELHNSPANEILFGGAAGPGKSHALRWEGFLWACRIPGLQVYPFRRTLKELEDNHILKTLSEYPGQPVCEWREQKKRWEFTNGSMIHMCHCQHEKDAFNRQGAEMHLLLIDELGTFTAFIYDYFRARTRCTLVIPPEFQNKIPGIICASNPGGPGHGFIVERWIDGWDDYVCHRAPKREGGMMRQYIPGLLHDNPILLERDPGYVDRLDGLPEPYRTAYKEGDWTVFLGQAFKFSDRYHVMKPMPIPDNAPLMMTFDWGYGKPYSTGWWWEDQDGRLYRFAELYGMMPGQPDVGLRQSDDEIAEQIVAKEKELGIWRQDIERYCDPTCFNKKPDYKGGGQGESTTNVFSRYGISMSAGDAARIHKIRQFHNRLRVKMDDDGNLLEMPMLMVYDCCVDFIRTIPSLQADPHKPEDVDTRLEDHIYDESCHAVMARPMGRHRETNRKRRAKGPLSERGLHR